MLKKKSLTATGSSMTGAAAAKSSSTLPKNSSSDAPPPAPAPPAPPGSIAKPGDWLASSITKRDEKRARSLGLVSSDEGNVILPGAISPPNPPAGFTMVFLSFLYRGLLLPTHEFLLRLLRTYEIQLWQLTPNSILHVDVFITLCEAFLGIEPHFGLWKKIFYVKRYSSSNGSFVIGGVGFVARSEVNYFSFPMRESVQGWRLKWFYVKDSLTTESQLPCFADVLEAKPKDSWKNILSPDERAATDELFAKFLRIKEADGQTMIGTEVAAVFLKCRVQPVMARVRPMWLYTSPKYETRINVAELSEKELLDEVRHLTLFSQEDSIPLISSYTPLDADHPLSEVPIVSGNLQDSPNDTSEGRGSSVPVDFHTAEHIDPEDEHDDPIDSEAAHANPPSSADDACNTEGSVRDDDADRDAFIDAAVEEARASPAKRSIGGFADEDDLFDISRQHPCRCLGQNSKQLSANGPSMTLASHQPRGSFLKGKGAMARIHSMIFPKISQDKTLGQLIDAFAVDTKEVIEVFPVSASIEDSSGALSEDDRIQHMKDRITQLEKDLRNTYALAAIIKKKGEIAADVERYALTKLHEATESLNCSTLAPESRCCTALHFAAINLQRASWLR
ncbi:hypothetical protein QYE76_036919 [Lolium multiflorum]|uniref:Transposase (putative) gypsy type domain-containing protein n=1 Tax=Lolium multiflorum TaxID=4521 RepID=A0AAD8R2R2_LOLMU|nr:hypothetical protein QYE76_036919 [Lolium multiflorum]